jgi:hypothetical protein
MRTLTEALAGAADLDLAAAAPLLPDDDVG